MNTLVDVRLLTTILLATLPMLGAILWNLMEVKSIRAELVEIRKIMQSLGERVATLEERDRWRHQVVEP